MIRFTFLIIISLIIFSCNNSSDSNSEININDSSSENSIKSGTENLFVEIYNVHNSNPDSTSIAVGNYSNKSVDRYFSKEKERGLVKYFDLNIEDSKNAALLKKLEITNSGLFIHYKNADKESFENLTDFAFLTAVDEPEMLMQALKTNIKDKIKNK